MTFKSDEDTPFCSQSNVNHCRLSSYINYNTNNSPGATIQCKTMNLLLCLSETVELLTNTIWGEGMGIELCNFKWISLFMYTFFWQSRLEGFNDEGAEKGHSPLSNMK